MVLSSNMFCHGFSVIVEKLQHKSCNIFITKKLAQTSEILSFLPRWDYCWKCEFDTDVKTENYYHHDRESVADSGLVKLVVMTFSSFSTQKTSFSTQNQN